MKIIPLVCPNCNANLEVKGDRDFIYCEHCGTKIIIDKEEQVSRHIDEARIREADVSEKIRLKELELALFQKQRRFVLIIVGGIIGVILLIAAIYLLFFSKAKSEAQNGAFWIFYMVFMVALVYLAGKMNKK